MGTKPTYEELEQRVKELEGAHEINKRTLWESPVGISTYRPDGQCVSANEALGRMIGATREQVLGQNFREIESWKKSGLLADAEEVLSSGIDKRRDVHVQTTFGREVCLECYFSRFMLLGEPHLLAMFNDITERKQAEDALRDSRKRYKELWNDAPVAYHMLDSQGIIRQVNRTETDMLGYTREEMVGKPIFEFVLPEQRKEAEERFRLKLAGENVPRQDDRVYVKKDGSKIFVSIDDVVEHDTNGKLLGVRTTMVDITELKQAQEALRKSEEKYRQLIDHYGNPITVFDRDGRLILINVIGAKNLGGTPEDFIGKSMCDLFPDQADIFMERNRQVFASGMGSDYEDEFELPSGKRWFWSGLQPVHAPSGETFAVQIISHDITKRKQAEDALRESEKKYSTVVENSLTGIYIDQDEKIVFANSRFAEIYGYPLEELIGMRSWRLVRPENRTMTGRMRERNLRGQEEPSQYEARGLTKNDETIWVGIRNTSIEYNGKPAILGNVVDITEQKRAEEERRRINEELKNFVNIVSHDLKTPAISIQGFSSRLLKKYQGKLGDKGRRYLEQIKTSARQMEALVSDLLELARLGQIVPVFQNVPTLEMAKKATSVVQGKLRDGEITLIVGDNLPTVYCDVERTYQVFENLLVNAIKFTRGTKNPRIEVGYEDKGDFHQFCVRDNGIGIDPKHHRKIFEMFRRLRQIEDDEGTGLGLAIVDKVVHEHGGKVWVESEEGKGATFYFTLPKVPDRLRQS